MLLFLILIFAFHTKFSKEIKRVSGRIYPNNKSRKVGDNWQCFVYSDCIDHGHHIG